jgi:hypothetical protein
MNTLQEQSCPLCASERVTWQLYRVSGRRTGNSQRELRWSCRACGHEWSASTSDGPDTPEIVEIAPVQ